MLVNRRHHKHSKLTARSLNRWVSTVRYRRLLLALIILSVVIFGVYVGFSSSPAFKKQVDALILLYGCLVVVTFLTITLTGGLFEKRGGISPNPDHDYVYEPAHLGVWCERSAFVAELIPLKEGVVKPLQFRQRRKSDTEMKSLSTRTNNKLYNNLSPIHSRSTTSMIATTMPSLNETEDYTDDYSSSEEEEEDVSHQHHIHNIHHHKRRGKELGVVYVSEIRRRLTTQPMNDNTHSFPVRRRSSFVQPRPADVSCRNKCNNMQLPAPDGIASESSATELPTIDALVYVDETGISVLCGISLHKLYIPYRGIRRVVLYKRWMSILKRAKYCVRIESSMEDELNVALQFQCFSERKEFIRTMEMWKFLTKVKPIVDIE
eukprot:CFRG2991T1